MRRQASRQRRRGRGLSSQSPERRLIDAAPNFCAIHSLHQRFFDPTIGRVLGRNYSLCRYCLRRRLFSICIRRNRKLRVSTRRCARLRPNAHDEKPWSRQELRAIAVRCCCLRSPEPGTGAASECRDPRRNRFPWRRIRRAKTYCDGCCW